MAIFTFKASTSNTKQQEQKPSLWTTSGEEERRNGRNNANTKQNASARP